MLEQSPKLIHAFGALAELGQEVANKNNFQETIRTSLHLLSGALGIMRGGVARYSRYGRELNMLAVRGLGDDFPLSLSVCVEDERQFLTNGLNAIDAHAARVLPFFQVYATSFERRRIELFVPLIIRDEIVGGLFLGIGLRQPGGLEQREECQPDNNSDPRPQCERAWKPHCRFPLSSCISAAGENGSGSGTAGLVLCCNRATCRVWTAAGL